jgi:hypothetical protein
VGNVITLAAITGNDLIKNDRIHNYLYTKIFGKQNPEKINAGVYMGYAKEQLKLK